MAFRGLQAESVAQGEAHKAIAKELHTLVADPFNEWAQGYKVCVAMIFFDSVHYQRVAFH